MNKSSLRLIVGFTAIAVCLLQAGCGETAIKGDAKKEVNPNFSPAHKAMVEKIKAEDDRK